MEHASGPVYVSICARRLTHALPSAPLAWNEWDPVGLEVFVVENHTMNMEHVVHPPLFLSFTSRTWPSRLRCPCGASGSTQRGLRYGKFHEFSRLSSTPQARSRPSRQPRDYETLQKRAVRLRFCCVSSKNHGQKAEPQGVARAGLHAGRHPLTLHWLQRDVLRVHDVSDDLRLCRDAHTTHHGC